MSDAGVPFWCRIGLHVMIACGSEQYTQPTVGPFDPRVEAERTRYRDMQVCARCGIKKENAPFRGYTAV